MKTATVREAQHHLSKLLENVEQGQEIMITRRGVEVAKLVPAKEKGDHLGKKVDWNAWLAERKEQLRDMPPMVGSIVLEERESYRW